MRFVNIHDAKTHLSKYLDCIEKNDETVVICRYGRPIARLTKYPAGPVRKLGIWKGKIEISEDFDELPDEFGRYFVNEER